VQKGGGSCFLPERMKSNGNIALNGNSNRKGKGGFPRRGS